MTNNEHRAIELEFYCIIQLIYNIQRNANFLVAMLEGLHFIADSDEHYYPYDHNRVMSIEPQAKQLLWSLRFMLSLRTQVWKAASSLTRSKNPKMA